MTWQEKAACKGMDTEIFFANGRLDKAKKICAKCSVMVDCLSEQLQFENRYHRFGVFGGLSAFDRGRKK